MDSVFASAPFRLSVLDQSPIREGGTAGEALHNSIELAQLADRLGYERFWIAEHHGTPALASASPEALIGIVAAATSRIHVGSGGIMLPHYSPLKVAETFSMLSALYPGRIDLGIGRAAGTSQNVAYALQRDRRQRSPDDFPEQLDELLGYFSAAPASGPLAPVSRSFPPFHTPRPFLLGSSPQSAIWAAELGLPYAFADFINPDGAQIVNYYRARFRPSHWGVKPHVTVATWTLCAETTEEAKRLSASSRMMLTLLFRGQLITVPTVEKAEQFLAAEGVDADFAPANRRYLAGSPEIVKASLEYLALEYGGPDEIALVNIVYDHQARLRSYKLIAEAFALSGAVSHSSELVLA